MSMTSATGLTPSPGAAARPVILPNAVVSKGNARLGSVLGEPGTSLSIELVGPRVGKWNDHATRTGGNDLIGLFCAYRGYVGKTDFPLALNEIAHDFLGDPIQFVRPTAQPTPHQQIEATKRSPTNANTRTNWARRSKASATKTPAEPSPPWCGATSPMAPAKARPSGRTASSWSTA